MISAYRAGWAKRDLVTFLVRHARRASVGSTLLGQIWFLLLPLSELAVYYLLIVVIFERGSAFGPNPFVALMVGIMHYRFLQNAASTAMASIHSRSRVLLQIQLEPIVLVLAGFRRAIVDSAPGVALTLIAWVVSGGFGINARPAFYPLILLLWIAMVWIASLFLATATIFARDLSQFVPIVLRLLMYASPVLYTIDFYPDGLRPIALLNPIAAVFSVLDWALLGAPAPPAHVYAVIAVTFLAGFLLSHALYSWARPRITKRL